MARYSLGGTHRRADRRINPHLLALCVSSSGPAFRRDSAIRECAEFASEQVAVNGWSYDSAGNLTSIYGIPTSTRSFTYDGENREVTATISGNTSTYTYDGLGQRVMKASAGQTTVYVYDAFGNLTAEYSSQSAASPCGTATCYLTVDHLGSTRMLTDSNGNTAKLYDYLPFGEELLANQDGRSSSLYSSSPDGLGPKFTGQTWDGESSLYWFNVRHMSGAQGRFQGVDPGNAGANPTDPQTWNMYAYVGNNPLSYTDPSGMGEGGEVAACSVNPIACGVVIGVELGITLSHVFGNLGYSGPPVPNWSGTVWQTGPTQAPNYNDGPWSERNPYAGSGGVNTGGVFGSGNTDPFIFSLENSSGSWLENAPTIPGWLVNGIAGAGDRFTTVPFTTFSITVWARSVTPGGDSTNTNSRSYTVGGYLGTGYQAVVGAAVAADVAAMERGALFGTRLGGNQPLLNSNDTLRVGWSYIRSTGQYVFRIGGSAIGRIKSNPHINLWPPSWWFK